MEDFLGTVEKDAEVNWLSLLALDENHVFVVDRTGKITRLQFRTSPSAHLQQVDSVDIGQPVDVQPIVDNGRLYVADAGGKVRMINVVGFERLAEVDLASPAVGVLGLAGNRLLVETSNGQLLCLKTDDKLAQAWSMELAGDHLTGTPLLEYGQIVIATMNGKVLSINAESGVKRHGRCNSINSSNTVQSAWPGELWFPRLTAVSTGSTRSWERTSEPQPAANSF